MVRQLGVRAAVVSVGGGPGFEVVQLERLRPDSSQWRIVLLDAQRDMLEKQHWRRDSNRAPPDRVLGDAVRLPFPDESLDAVLSLGVLCCLTDAGADGAAEEAARVVRPGGFVVLSVPAWRGAADDARHARHGFVRVAGSRPGRSVFRKHK